MGRAGGIRWRHFVSAQTGPIRKCSGKSITLSPANRCGRNARVESTTRNHVRRCGDGTRSILLTARVFPGNRNKQVAPGHFRWLFHSEQKKKRRSAIGENPIFEAKLGGIAREVKAIHRVCWCRR